MECLLCKGNHPLYKCEAFIKMDVWSRTERVLEIKDCENCFSWRHRAAECLAGACYQCNVKHNSMLCHKKAAAKAHQALPLPNPPKAPQ